MRRLPPLRTAVALLFHVLLLHVSVLGGGMACAAARADVAPAAHDGGAHHGADHGASHGADHAAHVAAAMPADVPVDGGPAPHHGGAPTHCVTAAGCAAVAVAGPELTLAALASVDSSAERGRVSLPASTRPAPEPPPPRA